MQKDLKSIEEGCDKRPDLTSPHEYIGGDGEEYEVLDAIVNAVVRPEVLEGSH